VALPTPTGVTATDACDPNVRVSHQDTRTNGSCAYNYVITRVWTATDACGNTATASQRISVEDKIAPSLTNVPTNTSLTCDATVPVATNPTATDNCDPNPRVTFVENRVNGLCGNNYTLVRTWTVTDACGNTATASQSISVGDDTPPVLSGVPSNITLNCHENLPTGATCDDE
jgi:large repetitive protein